MMNPAIARRSWLFLLCVLLLASAPSGRAAVWVLANGDRLTGELVREDSAVIEVQHAQLGRLVIPRAALQPKAPVVRGSPGVPKNGTAVQPEIRRWKRQVDIGYAQQSGAKEKQDLSLRLQLDRKSGPNTYRGTARLLQTEADGKTVTDRREADFRWRHDVNQRLFAQTLTTYTEDNVRRIDLSLEQQLGGGYRVLDGDSHKANVGLGAVVQYLDRPDTKSQTALLGSLFQDYAYDLNPRLKITQEANITYTDAGTWSVRDGKLSVAQQGSYRLKFNTGVQSKVSEHMSVNVRFEYDYDRSVLERNLRADQRLTTSFGYLW